MFDMKGEDTHDETDALEFATGNHAEFIVCC